MQLLTQIAAQTGSYTISGSFVNATVSMAPGTNFHAAAIDLRVNILWFISLVLSLTSASFGILIKQWLREYKTVDARYAQMRARLRIRQFRYPGLTKWKVFELAALLPLLIQAALALFLVGLCLFTWSVTPTLGHATTPLVIAWISFFVLSAFAPSVSSDCPYKLPLVVPLLKPVRLFLSRTWMLKWLYMGPTVSRRGKEIIASDDYHSSSRWVASLGHSVVAALGVFWHSCCCCWMSDDENEADIFAGGGAFPETPDEILILGRKVDEEHTPLEEEQVAQDVQKDLTMLATVDNVLLDDDLLSITFPAVISQIQPSPADAIEFATSAMFHRLPQSQDPFPVLNLHSISIRAWEAVTDIVCDTLEKHFELYNLSNSMTVAHARSQEGDLSWVCKAFAILFAKVPASYCDIEFQNRRNDIRLLCSRIPGFLSRLLDARALQSWPFRDTRALFHQIAPRDADIWKDPVGTIIHIHHTQHCSKAALCTRPSRTHILRTHPPPLFDQYAMRSEVFNILTSQKSSLQAYVLQSNVKADIGELLAAMIAWAPRFSARDASAPYPGHSDDARQLLADIFRSLHVIGESYLTDIVTPSVAAELLRFLSDGNGLVDLCYQGTISSDRRLSMCFWFVVWGNGRR